MSRFNFTRASVQKYLMDAGSGVPGGIAYDEDVAGLGIYRNANGSGTYFLHYRVCGRQRKHTLGRFGQLPISEVRAKASALLVAAREGRDPIAERRIRDQASLTLGDAYAQYVGALEKRDSSAVTFRHFSSLWKVMLSEHRNREVACISKRMVRDWHQTWGARGPSSANHAARLLRSIINYAHKITDGLPPNPCSAIEHFRETQSRPVLALRQLPDWRLKVDALENPIRAAYWRFLLFTGLRATDAATIRLADLADHKLHRPLPKGGAAKAFDLPLSRQAIQILKDAHSLSRKAHPESPYAFASASKSGHIANMREDSFPVTPHVLRRTYATACIEAGVDPFTVKLLLNHQPDKSDVTARYIKPSHEFLMGRVQAVADLIERAWIVL